MTPGKVQKERDRKHNSCRLGKGFQRLYSLDKRWTAALSACSAFGSLSPCAGARLRLFLAPSHALQYASLACISFSHSPQLSPFDSSTNQTVLMIFSPKHYDFLFTALLPQHPLHSLWSFLSPSCRGARSTDLLSGAAWPAQQTLALGPGRIAADLPVFECQRRPA